MAYYAIDKMDDDRLKGTHSIKPNEAKRITINQSKKEDSGIEPGLPTKKARK